MDDGGDEKLSSKVLELIMKGAEVDDKDYIEVKPDLEAKNKILMRCISDDGYPTATTGPIKCHKGFTARARLKTPVPGHSTWFDEYVYLIDAQVPVGECFDKIRSVFRKEDPGTWAYGVFPGNPTPNHNLKTASLSSTDSLPQHEPVDIKYDKELRRVDFTSAHWKYYQEDLPEDVDFKLAVSMCYTPTEVEIEFLSIDGKLNYIFL